MIAMTIEKLLAHLTILNHFLSIDNRKIFFFLVVGKLPTKLSYGILTDNGIKIEKHSKAGKQFHKKNHQPKSKMDQLDKSLSNILGTKWDVVVNV